MQLLYINEMEKITKLSDFHIKQRRGCQVTHHWDKELTEEEIKQVKLKAQNDAHLANSVKKI